MCFNNEKTISYPMLCVKYRNEDFQGFSCERKIKEKPFYVTACVKKEATAMDGGRFHAEAIFWFCQNSLSKVYMDVHF